VAATKSYIAELMAIAMLSVALEKNNAQLGELYRCVDYVRHGLQQEAKIKMVAEKYSTINSCVIIGRGFNYATAFEWALKLKELSYTLAEPYSSADFLHGPQALLNEGFPVFLVAPNGKIYPEFLYLLGRLKETFKADTLVISNKADLLDMASTSIDILDPVPEWLSPLVCIAMIQLFCIHLTMAKGLDIEQPRSLSKVTKTL
jgi:glucosamine--fructose-6-phosphate aminotransferase (isomerizing)